MSSFLRLAVLLALAGAVVAAPAASNCTGTIASLDDVDDAVKCTTVVINSFTVPAGETLNLDLAEGTTVNMGTSLAHSLFCTHSSAGHHGCRAGAKVIIDRKKRTLMTYSWLAEGDVTFAVKNWDGPLFQVR